MYVLQQASRYYRMQPTYDLKRAAVPVCFGYETKDAATLQLLQLAVKEMKRRRAARRPHSLLLTVIAGDHS